MNKYQIFIVLLLLTVTIHCEEDKKENTVGVDEQKKTSQLTVNDKTQQASTEKQSCVERVLRDSLIGGLIGGGSTAAVGAGSAAAISAAGFTTSGVAAGSIAAGLQSGIGLVGAGSTFAGFQSLGALGYGILGGSALPIILGVAAVGAIGGGAYVAYECINEQ